MARLISVLFWMIQDRENTFAHTAVIALHISMFLKDTFDKYMRSICYVHIRSGGDYFSDFVGFFWRVSWLASYIYSLPWIWKSSKLRNFYETEMIQDHTIFGRQLRIRHWLYILANKINEHARLLIFILCPCLGLIRNVRNYSNKSFRNFAHVSIISILW